MNRLRHYHLPDTPSASTPCPEAGITEVPCWEEPTRIIVLTTADGVRQWRCEGLASNVTPEGLRILADLLEDAENRSRLHDSVGELLTLLVPARA